MPLGIGGCHTNWGCSWHLESRGQGCLMLSSTQAPPPNQEKNKALG